MPYLKYNKYTKFLVEKLSLKQINAIYNIFMIKTGLNKSLICIFTYNISTMTLKNSKIKSKHQVKTHFCLFYNSFLLY